MGVRESVLPNTDIQSKATLAEALIIKRVPQYADLTGDNRTFLESAVIVQICSLLCPGMPQRIKIAQSDETGYSFKIQYIDWAEKKSEFDGLINDYLFLAAGGEIEPFNPLGVVRGDRDQTGSYPQ